MAQATFGNILKTLRKQQNITQQELASRIGVHRNTIGIWERGDYLPESKTIVLELAHKLQLSNCDTQRLLEASLTTLSPHWQVPYQQNPFFTVREALLATLHQILFWRQTADLPRSYALCGLSGIGKTAIAIEYAYRHTQEYSAIFWIEATTQETILASM